MENKPVSTVLPWFLSLFLFEFLSCSSQFSFVIFHEYNNGMGYVQVLSIFSSFETVSHSLEVPGSDRIHNVGHPALKSVATP